MENNVLNLIREFYEIKNELTTQIRSKFFDLFKDVFESCDKLKSFSWCQYTPYFNDGDVCEFQANTDNLSINGEFELHHFFHYDVLNTEEDVKNHAKILRLKNRPDDNKIIGQLGYTFSNRYDENFYIACSEVESRLNKIPQEILLEVFGNDKIITVNSDNVVILEDFEDHD